jgi:hypothetical protein
MLNLLSFDLRQFISFNSGVKLIIFYICMFSTAAYEINLTLPHATIMDLCLFVFGGIPYHFDNIWFILRWLLIYGFSLYLIGDALDRDYRANRLYLLIRINSRCLYVLSKLISLFVFACFYILIGYLFACIYGAIFFEGKFNLSNEFIETFELYGFSLNLGSIVLISILGLFCMFSIMLLLNILMGHSRFSIVYMVALLFFNAKFLTGLNMVSEYNFLNRTMGFQYLYHEREGTLYSLSGSFLCFFIYILLFSCLSLLIFRRKDRII